MIDDGPPNLGPAIRAIVETYVPDRARWPDAEAAIGAVIYVETVRAERAVAERKAAIGHDEIRNVALIEARNAAEPRMASDALDEYIHPTQDQADA